VSKEKMKKLDFTYSTLQRDHFRSGELMNDWAQKYPMLFDRRDVEICQNQPDYHFFEWLGAIVLFEATGYLSLIEKYETKSHKRKFNTFRQVVPNVVFDHILSMRTGIPDLFVYSKDFRYWFFCEIKGNRDVIRKNQLARFNDLEKISGSEVIILKFNKLVSSSAA
jgi:hypothetical protein